MAERELEKVMLKFMHHEADVLVATTIIENGLDITLCNTMVDLLYTALDPRVRLT